MRFISYAQNFEDVMLWRALRHVQGGFYIDVGANDPLRDSVTKAFYERGWHGINIEPVAKHFADLERDRDRDVNLQCALGAGEGTIEFWEWDTEGLATTDADVARQHLAQGRRGQSHVVPVRTLASVCAEHGSGEIHFLKIDVEGGEDKVLSGADFQRFRPWIVVVEATRPNSTEHVYQHWEPLLTSANYECVYDDGLNRFYVAAEHAGLKPAFAYPPNVFDGFVVAQQYNAEQAAERTAVWANELEQAARGLQAQFASATESAAVANERALQFSDRALQAEARTQEFVARAARAETEAAYRLEMAQAAQQALALRESQLEQARLMIQHLYASSSWRVTRPLRWLAARLKGEQPVDPATTMQALNIAPNALRHRASGAGGPLPEALQIATPRAKDVYERVRTAADAVRQGR